MSQKNQLEQRGSVKIEPLKGQFFDIKPSDTGKMSLRTGGSKDYFRFALVAFFAFLALSFGNAYIEGRDVLYESETLAYAGYENIKVGMNYLMERDEKLAFEAFSAAKKAFESLEETTGFLAYQAGDLTGENLYFSAANILLESALEVAGIGQKLAELMGELKDLPSQLLDPEKFDVMQLAYEKKESLDELKKTTASLQRKLTSLNTVVLPAALELKIQNAQNQVGEFLGTLLEFDEYFDYMTVLAGDKIPHRYLIMFQNNNEIRATGGFIGSYMIVEVNDGKITKMEAKDVYESDGQLSEVVEAPAGINKVADRLYMRDANYNPNFPSSAESIMWFLEASRGPSVDTVIAIDQSVVEGLLKLMPPLRLPSVPFQITAENFNDIISFYTEAKLSETATPKQLLFDLIPAFKKNISTLTDMGALIELAEKMRDEGHIQVYSKDASIQSLAKKFKLTGEMIQVENETDYLSVISTSIGGNKSDAYIETTITHATQLFEGGELNNVVTIKKEHTWGQKNDTILENLIEKYGTGKLTKESLYFILGRGPNLDYMRVYVPLGSQLESVDGLEISKVNVSEDNGYTVFGFTYGPVNAGGTKQLSLHYKLPFNLPLKPLGNYKFIAQKQAGAENQRLNKTLEIADTLRVEKSYPTSPFSLIPSIEKAFNGVEIFMTSVVKR